MVAPGGQPGIKDRAVPISAVSFLVLLIGPAVLAGVAHSAWLATIGLLGASSCIVLSGAMFRVRLAFARNVPVVASVRRLLNQVKHATSACSRR